ncbi:MAG: hypothetical protein ACI837_002583 [Crocinitomicaceae bacterium]|jgi:hypothetical protein
MGKTTSIEEQLKVSRREIYYSAESINTEDWNTVAQDRNIYLSLDYLVALEDAMNSNMDFFYSISYAENGTPLVVSAFQLVQFIDKRRAYSKQLCMLSEHLHKKIMNVFTINVLVCGNVFSDGENGFLWGNIDSQDAVEEVAIVVEELKKNKKINDKASVTLFKEFGPTSVDYSDQLIESKYRDFMMDVNMVLKIHAGWKTFEDYLFSMKTKFRTRAKSVYKNSSNLIIKDFSTEDIRTNSERIDTLFGNVVEKSDFSYGRLSANAFANFKEKLNNRFSFKAFMFDNDIVGFSTSFMNGNKLEANFVGLDYEYNTKLSVYQRILYDYVEQALNVNSKELHLGRTAEQIKSSIGALPMNMKLYARHRKGVTNLLLKPIIQSISPSEFELRPPFKSDFQN